MKIGPNPFYVPKHRRTVTLPTDTNGWVFADVQNDAACTCRPGTRFDVCARHNADRYADQYARHATDSIGQIIRPVVIEQADNSRYDAFHSFGVTR